MINPLKFLLACQYKSSQSAQKTGGFTLIELLVALILVSLIIASLLSFMVNILSTDRKEQAKSSSEQEIQAALDYIARDLEQATYIYDQVGVAAIQSQIPPAGGTLPVPGCPDAASCQPVLVFWKREFLQQAFPGTGTNDPDENDDTFVYSLVAYYHIKDPTCPVTSNWSCTSRIGRFQIKDGVRDLDGDEIRQADDGFAPPPSRTNQVTLTPQTPQQLMNSWEKNGSYTNNPGVLTLIDYIDQTDVASAPPAEACPPLVDDSGVALNPVDVNPFVGGLVNTSSFYACVDPTRTTAQVFIRGNALARIEAKNNPPIYNPNLSVYFPSAKMQIRGRGTFGGT